MHNSWTEKSSGEQNKTSSNVSKQGRTPGELGIGRGLVPVGAWNFISEKEEKILLHAGHKYVKSLRLGENI